MSSSKDQQAEPIFEKGISISCKPAFSLNSANIFFAFS
jgi:hypothetical protein